MTDLKRISGIDINQDMDYQWREWRVQRVAWVVFIAIILAALLGLLGQGPLSVGHVATTDGALALEFERIDRAGAPTGMTATLAPNTAQGGAVSLSLDRDFMDRISIDEIVPEPESVETGSDAVTYTFDVKEPARSANIRFDFQHELAGPARGALRLEGGPELSFEMFVWP